MSNNADFLDTDDFDIEVSKRAVYYDRIYEQGMNDIDIVIEKKKSDPVRELGEILKNNMLKLSQDQKILAEMVVREEVSLESLKRTAELVNEMDMKYMPVTDAKTEIAIVKRIAQRVKTIDSDYAKFTKLANV